MSMPKKDNADTAHADTLHADTLHQGEPIRKKRDRRARPAPRKGIFSLGQRLFAGGHLAEQMFFVFAAFAVMVLVSYLFISRIVTEQMDIQCRSTFENTYHQVNAIFNNLEMIALNMASDVEIALNEGKSIEEIQEYMRTAAALDKLFTPPEKTGIARRIFYPEQGYAPLEHTLLERKGPRCVIHDKYIHGGGWIPPEEYDFREREWYRKLEESDGELIYTNLYFSPLTQNYSFGLGRALYAGEAGNGQPIGVLQLDVEVARLIDIIASLQQLERGYAVLIDPRGFIVVHHEPNQIGKLLFDTSLGGKHIGENFENISRDYTSPTQFHSKNADGVWSLYNCGILPNGWLVASVIPAWNYRAHERLVGVILVVLGTILATTLCFFLRKLSLDREQANLRSQSKSLFLARMSHEIRTPMNAIAGLSQLIAREKGQLPSKVIQYSVEINHAARNLLTIINDVLDLAKVEAGKVEVVPVPFTLSSLLDDVIRITQIRAHEKGLQFVSYVDTALPNALIGDVVHIRQVLLNILGNAVKYTQKGCIAFDALSAHQEDDTITISFIIRDTGIGIKLEDQSKIFADFSQVGMENNWNIEGAGLGLAICKELVDKLGGSISVHSQPKEGTTFIVDLPVVMENNQPCITVQHAEEHCVLVYEPRPVYEQSLIRSLNHLNIPSLRVQSISSFRDVLQQNRNISLIFVASFIFDEISRFTESLKPSVTRLILLCESSEQVSLSHVRSAVLPINALHIARFLNDTQPEAEEGSEGCTGIKMPTACILVVDDNRANLLVAEGLLSPYGCQVDTVMSGRAALQRVQKCQYDLILMDHMMPEMDGLETTRHLRDLVTQTEDCRYCETVPIIAFTANAVFGMKELFLQNGMDDLLTKPVDSLRLNEVLLNWIPKEKQQAERQTSQATPAAAEDIHIPGVDSHLGRMLTGGTLASYLRVLTVLCCEWESKTGAMEAALKNNDFATYKRESHSYKTILGTIGAQSLAERAAILETAAQHEDRTTINDHHVNFINGLRELVSSTATVLNAMREQTAHPAISAEEADWLRTQLTRLRSAITEKKMHRVDMIMDELLIKTWTKDTREGLEKILQSLTLFEWSDAMSQIEQLLEHQEICSGG